MSEPSIINTPAACIKCGFITDSPTTGKTHDRCPCCGGKLITISQLTPGENVIVLAKRASWECSNDDGEWYGRKTTEEQIIKHFASLGTELATLRAKLEEAQNDTARLDWLESWSMKHEVCLSHDLAPDCITPTTQCLWTGKRPLICTTDLRAAIDLARKEKK